MRKVIVAVFCCSMVLFVGCGESSPTPAKTNTTQLTDASRQGDPNTDPAAIVTREFLQALTSGDSNAARSCLTPIAIERIAELGLDLVLPVQEGSRFEIGTVEIYEDNTAAVDTTWIEPMPNGQVSKEQMTVGLELIEGTWCVRCVATGLGPNETPDGYDFEAPDQPSMYSNVASGRPAANDQSNSQPAAQQATLPATQDPFRQ